MPDPVYHVWFQTESGERMDYNVKHQLYNTLYVGAQGILSTKGPRFEDFEII